MDNKKLVKAKVGIILNQPFFATLMMRKQFIEDSNIKTASTNGKVIRYNPAYFDSLSNEEVQGVICHELLHGTLLHHIRREGRDPEQWNEAADYSLNPILIDGGMKLPKGALVSSRFENMSAEDVYKVLGKERRDEEKENNEPGAQEGQGDPGEGDDKGEENSGQEGQEGKQHDGIGEVVDCPAKTQSELSQAEAESKQELAQAMQIAKQQGKLPANLERLAAAILEPKVDWKEALARFLTEVAHNDYSFSKPNTRYLSSGFILPSLYNLEVGNIYLFVDTSGSIDEEALNRVASEMQGIASNYNSPINVLYIDSEVAGEQIIEPDDVFKLEPKGGGGTDFEPGFDWLKENGITPAAVVYFTDGCCNSFPETPDFSVLWCKSGGYRFNPPFGETIDID